MPTGEEMREALVKIRQKERDQEIEKENARVDKARAETEQNILAKHRKDRHVKDPESGNLISRWDKANREADRLIKAGINNMVDWRAAMMDLVNAFGALNEAMHQTVMEKLRTPLPLIGKSFWGILEVIPVAMADGIRKLGSDPDVALPQLIHHVEFTDEDELNIAPLLRSDDGTDVGELDALFEAGIVKWLEECGYKPVPPAAGANPPQSANKEFVDENGAALTKAEFDRLKNDPDEGLTRFLTEYSDLSFTPKP